MYYALMHEAKMRFKMMSNYLWDDETGDTNLISILIVLGFVILLVVFFQDQIEAILGTVKTNMKSFNGNTNINIKDGFTGQ